MAAPRFGTLPSLSVITGVCDCSAMSVIVDLSHNLTNIHLIDDRTLKCFKQTVITSLTLKFSEE